MTAPTSPGAALAARDLDRLRARGISVAEAEWQLEQLRHPPRPLVLVRPCTVADGIERIESGALPDLHARHERAAAAGEITSFVPASGAASRMFRDLMAYREDRRAVTRAELDADRAAGRPEAAVTTVFADQLRRFAFWEALRETLSRRGIRLEDLEARGPFRPILEALLDDDGLGYARIPKGLVAFHAYPNEIRTAFEEHLAEATALYRDGEGRVRLHATVPVEDVDRFEAELATVRSRRERGGARLDVELTVQDPATDTLALDGSGQPFRDASGELVLRPAGHGALLRNLASIATPVVVIKNIDNVAAEPFQEPTLVWVRAVIGRLCELRESAGRDDDRPLRVCAMVPNTGEPGGGPYWVRDGGGRVTCQIVESAQVRMDDPEQRAVVARGSHFNPVLIACLLQDGRGRRCQLDRYVDPHASFVARRSWGGRDLLALERPGLWNGGMAGWNTVFVEIPIEAFNPVKAVTDLLRREHQPLLAL